MNTNNDKPRYFAAICSCSKDATFAAELQNFLEHYRLPNKISRQFPHLPGNVRPISGNPAVTPDLQRLAESKYLIAICSQDSATPDATGKCHLDTEVEAFIAANPKVNEHRVIPIIYRKKDGPRATACLPESIRSRSLLAADILDKGKDRTFSDVVAKMLGLNPEQLWDRWEMEQAAKRRNRRIAISSLALAAIVGSCFAWDYYVPHTYYYADYAECNNIPVGIHRLSSSQVEQLASHYRFTECKHLVVRVSHCDASGTPTPHTQDWDKQLPTTLVMRYNDHGNAASCISQDEHGNAKASRIFHESGKLIRCEQAGASTDGAEQKDGIARIIVTRDAQGRVIREIYQNAYTEPCADDIGVWGREYTRNTDGQIVEVRYLDRYNHVAPCTKDGSTGYTLTRNELGQVVSMTVTAPTNPEPANN